ERVSAIRTQAGRMIHTSTLYLIRPMVELAEQLAPLSGIPGAKVFFTTSGTEANEAALLLASTARRSNQVLALRNSYHGRSFATVGITGNRGWSASSLTPFTVHYVDAGHRFPAPIQGVGGFTVPPDGLFGALKVVLDEYGILYVSDEVQTGWGRTGEHFWGYQAHDLTPDLLTFAKGLGNGLAMAGVIGRGHLGDGLTANSISPFGGNPLVAAGA